MTDRPALAAALDKPMHYQPSDPGKEWWDAREVERTAARERLAQLPEKAEKCAHGMREPHAYPDVKPGEATGAWREQCPGPGKVYPAELVERVARAIGTDKPNHAWAIAVLDALNGETG